MEHVVISHQLGIRGKDGDALTIISYVSVDRKRQDIITLNIQVQL